MSEIAPFPDQPSAQADLQTLAAGLAAGEFSPAQQELIATSDPELLAAWLVDQELAPLAYVRLKATGFGQALLPLLAPAYWEQVAATAIKYDLLSSLLTDFAAAGLATVLLKGMAHGFTIYEDAAVRPMNDLDFWIQVEDLPLAWQLVEAQGFSSKGLWPDLRSIPPHITQLDFYPERPQDSPLNIEMHWDLCQKTAVQGRLPLQKWWRQTRQISWRGQQVALLAPGAALLHAAVHQMIEHRSELRWCWLLDIDQLIRGRPTYHLTAQAWQEAAQEAAAAGVLPAVQKALELVHHYLETPLPPAAQDLLALPGDLEAGEQVADIMHSDRSTAGKVFLNAGQTPGLWRKTAVVRHILLPHPDYMMQRYAIRHKFFLPVFYAGRLAKGTGMALSGWWQKRRR